MSIDYEAREAMQALRGKLSKRATSAEFNEWMAREVCEYIDALTAENRRHILHKKWASEAVGKVLTMCQNTPHGWMSMDKQLASFKRQVFSALEIPCLNLGWRASPQSIEEPVRATRTDQQSEEDA